MSLALGFCNSPNMYTYNIHALGADKHPESEFKDDAEKRDFARNKVHFSEFFILSSIGYQRLERLHKNKICRC